MEDYGKLKNFEIEEITSNDVTFIDEVKVSFDDLPDNGYYKWTTVNAKNGKEAIRLVKKNLPNAQDIIIWSCKELSSPETNKPSLKSFLVSYYVVTNKEDKVLKSNKVEAMENKIVKYQLNLTDHNIMSSYGLSIENYCMLKAMEEYGKLENFEIKFDVKKGSTDPNDIHSLDNVVMFFNDLPDNGYYKWTTVKAKNRKEAIRLVKNDFPNAEDIKIWSSQKTNKSSLRSFLVSYYVVTNK